jgi:UDP-N-acetylmuramoyl-tripeptide--D-alanyl-D-alanine ligase
MTALWTALEAAQATGGAIASGASWVAQGVSIDSRRVGRDDLFVALKGPRFDGHDFVATALAEQAAAAAMVERPAPGADSTRLLVVPDTMAGLTALALRARARSAARIAAVTGSVGKTGTKEMLALALGRQGAAHASAGNLNNHIGLPLSLARMPAATRFGIFELGMNHAGEIEPLSSLLRPHVAVITTVEAVHIENFPDVAAIADAKAEIFAGMGPDGTAILNRDNMHFERLAGHAVARGIGTVWSFGEDSRSDARLVAADFGPLGSSARAVILGREVAFGLNLPGRHHVLNTLAVLLAVAAVGGDVDEAAAAMADFAPVAGRGVSVDIAVPGGSVQLIDESYNASPAAVRAALAVLAMMRPPAAGRRIAVLGDMLELGVDAPAAHAGLVTPLIEAGVDLVFTAGPLMRHLHNALPANRRGVHAEDAASLAEQVGRSVAAGDIVLVKGSAGSKMGTIVAALRDSIPATGEARHAV